VGNRRELRLYFARGARQIALRAKQGSRAPCSRPGRAPRPAGGGATVKGVRVLFSRVSPGRWVRRRRLPLSPRRNSSGGTASDRHLRRKTAPSERGSECGRSCAGKRVLNGLIARPWGRGTLAWGLNTAPTPVAVACGPPLDPSPSASQMDPRASARLLPPPRTVAPRNTSLRSRWKVDAAVGQKQAGKQTNDKGKDLTWALIWIMAGSKKASVLPLPVAEMPIMSRPRSAMGHPCDWIGDAAMTARDRGVGQGVVRVLVRGRGRAAVEEEKTSASVSSDNLLITSNQHPARSFQSGCFRCPYSFMASRLQRQQEEEGGGLRGARGQLTLLEAALEHLLEACVDRLCLGFRVSAGHVYTCVCAVIPAPTFSTYSGMEASSKVKLHTEINACEDDDVTGKVGGPVSVVRTKAWGSRCLAR